jgi:hypothetical protein
VCVRELLDKDIGSIMDAPLYLSLFKYLSLFCTSGGSRTSSGQVNP